MDISGIIKAIVAAPEDRRSSGPPELAPGDRLTGRVLRLESDGRILIDLGGHRALAQTGIAVKPGQLLPLQVVATGPPMHLRLDSEAVGKPGQSLSGPETLELFSPAERRRLIELIGRLTEPAAGIRAAASTLAADVRQALSAVRAHLIPLIPSLPGEQVAAQLRHFTEEGGILFERRMADLLHNAGGIKYSERSAEPAQAAGRAETEAAPASSGDFSAANILRRDLKPNLIFLKEALAPGGELRHPALAALPQKALDLLRRGVSQMLASIEHQQERLVQRGSSDYGQVTVHWLAMENQARPVALRIHYPTKDNRQSPDGLVYQVALLLQMDRLGALRADLCMQGKGLRVDLHVADADVRAAVEARLDEMNAALSPHFEPVLLTVHAGEEQIIRFLQEEGRCTVEARRIDVKV